MQGAVVLVTGASSGIGRVTARRFAQRGATVMAVARRETLLRQLVEEWVYRRNKREVIPLICPPE